jgi:hypothetical protein
MGLSGLVDGGAFDRGKATEDGERRELRAADGGLGCFIADLARSAEILSRHTPFLPPALPPPWILSILGPVPPPADSQEPTGLAVEDADEVGEVVEDGEVVLDHDHVVVLLEQRADRLGGVDALLHVQVRRRLVEPVGGGGGRAARAGEKEAAMGQRANQFGKGSCGR